MAKSIGGMTASEVKMLGYLRSFIEKNGYAPTYTEIGKATGYASKSSIAAVLAHLEKDGLVKRTAGKRGGIAITDRGMRVSIPDHANG